MPRKANPDFLRVCYVVNRDDHVRMAELYPNHGVSFVIRALMRAHLTKVDNKVKETTADLEELDVGDI